MKASTINFWGTSRYWWLVLILGLVIMFCGLAYWFWPQIGFAVSSTIFGWMMVLFGIVQLCVASGPDRAKGWGWWLVGGIIDIFIGFMLVRSVILSEMVFPYFISIVFLFWGISAIFNSISQKPRKYWWLYLVNGILLMIVGFLFLEAGYVQDMMMTSLLTAIAFCYWGFVIAMLSYDMKPIAESDSDK